MHELLLGAWFASDVSGALEGHHGNLAASGASVLVWHPDADFVMVFVPVDGHEAFVADSAPQDVDVLGLGSALVVAACHSQSSTRSADR
jgi:hypothetical protein